MADTDTSAKPTSPYDYPRRPLPDPTPPLEEPTRNKKEDATSENPDTVVTVGTNDNDGNKEEENELPENEEKDEDEGEKGNTEKPLLEKDESVKLEIVPDNEGEDTPTLPLPDKKRKSKEALEIDEKPERKLPKYLFPITRIKNAWTDSSNVFQFLGNMVCIIFQTVGWFTCVGGIPFLSLVMLIIGCVYVNDCKIQPNIPVYLIVSGLIGTIQHFIVIWTKYIPKESQGRLKVYRSYCRCINGLFHLFTLIWFILGCVWIYGAHDEVDFRYPEKQEYCNETLYYFSFWILNLSFILIGLLVFLSLCFLVCAVTSEK